MNIELKPIAESKVRQLGGDVCGVLVRTEDSEVMAVSEHGRCTRLDAGVMGPVEPAGMSDMRDEFERVMADQAVLSWSESVGEYRSVVTQKMWEVWQAARVQGGQGAEVVDVDDLPYPDFCVVSFGHEGYELKDELFRDVESAARRANELEDKGFSVVIRQSLYTQPQPAVPEGIDVAVDMLEDYASALGNGDLDGAGHSTTQAIYEVIALLSTPTTPQPECDGRIKCSERLPTEDDADCFSQVWFCRDPYAEPRSINGLNLSMFYAVAENAEDYLKNWPEAYWAPTGLKRPQPPAGQEGA